MVCLLSGRVGGEDLGDGLGKEWEMMYVTYPVRGITFLDSH